METVLDDEIVVTVAMMSLLFYDFCVFSCVFVCVCFVSFWMI